MWMDDSDVFAWLEVKLSESGVEWRWLLILNEFISAFQIKNEERQSLWKMLLAMFKKDIWKLLILVRRYEKF